MLVKGFTYKSDFKRFNYTFSYVALFWGTIFLLTK